MASGVPLFSFVIIALFTAVSGRPGSDGELKIRKKILTLLDKTVRPSTGPDFKVEFSVQFNSLDNVDDKQQTITVKTWVVMKWNDTFIKWNESDYGGVQRVHFKPTEIWFPDIALYNNADREIPIAGSTIKFLSNVICKNNGKCTWSGSAIFTANCEIDITKWPFDTQTCYFNFTSSSYDSQMLQLSLSGDEDSHTSLDNFEEDNSWKKVSLEVSLEEADHGHCCPYTFSQISYGLTISRLSLYQMFYIFAPCCILTILSLMSFFIPSESGERIGFVTTLLLSLMVYLLVVPESLPASGKQIPILGVMLMITLVIISLVLFTTIIILICFFRTDNPPYMLRCLVSKKHDSRRATPQVHVEDHISLKGVQTAFALNSNEGSSRKPSTTTPQNTDPAVSGEQLWQKISLKLDKIFFGVFLIISIISYLALLVFSRI